MYGRNQIITILPKRIFTIKMRYFNTKEMHRILTVNVFKELKYSHQWNNSIDL